MNGWSGQQEKALADVSRWLKNPGSQQVYRLFGFAGTGKTTLATHFGKEVKRVAYMAFTGKASLMLRRKGCHGASTVHSSIYKLDDEGYGLPTFALDKDAKVRNVDLIILDEVSMIDEIIGTDLLSFGVKILVLGDPFQLPPIRSTGFFTEGKPDTMLTEIHRQALDNPIIRLSMDVRRGKPLEYGDFGAAKIIRRGDVVREDVLAADQVLCGINRTRVSFNERFRILKGVDNYPVPQPDEKVICLRNNREKKLLNGGLWSVIDASEDGAYSIKMKASSLDFQDADPVEANVHPFFFDGREAELPWEIRRESDEFTYGYTITVHKSQGSQWDHVYLFDESKVFGANALRHRYTGLTRAAEKIHIVQ